MPSISWKFWKGWREKMKKPKSEEKSKMVDKTVSFKISDGRKPGRVGPGRIFTLRAPIDFVIPAGSEMSLKTGVECSHPVMIISSKSVVDAERVAAISEVLDSNQEITVV